MKKFELPEITKAVEQANYWGKEKDPEIRKAHYDKLLADNKKLAEQMQIIGGSVVEDVLTRNRIGIMQTPDDIEECAAENDTVSLQELAEIINRVCLAEFLFINYLLRRNE